MAEYSEEGVAAKRRADYEVTVDGVTYNDWFLPAKDELQLLYANKDVVGDLAYNSYWNSTQVDDDDADRSATSVSFINGLFFRTNKDQEMNIRFVRAF